MDDGPIERAKQRLSSASAGRTEPAQMDAALERARVGLEGLAEAAAELESSLPDRVESALREGVRAEALPLSRQLAELRGLVNAVIRRLERLEGDVLAERHARVDDLALVVDLITSGWRSVDERLGRIERGLEATSGAVVYRIEERRPGVAPAGEGSGTSSS